MNEEAKERRLRAAIEEADGREMPVDLPDRIVAELATQPERRSFGGWLAAAAIVFGSSVVFAVDGCREPSSGKQEVGAQDPQDPQPAKPPHVQVRQAEVHQEGVVPIAAAPGVDRLQEIARDTRTNLVITKAVGAHSDVEVGGMPTRVAIERIADELRVSLTQVGNVLVVGRGTATLPRDRKFSLEGKNVPVIEFLKQMHAQTGVTIVAPSNLQGTIDCHVLEVPWYAMLQAVTGKLRLEIIGCGSALAVRRSKARPDRRRATAQTGMLPIEGAIAALARSMGGNVVSGQGLAGSIAANAATTDLQGMLAAIATTANADYSVADSIHHLELSRLPITTTTLTTEHTTPRELIDVMSGKLSSVRITSAIDLRISVFARRARVDDLLRAAACASGGELRREGGNYVVE